MKHFLKSFVYAFRGIFSALKKEFHVIFHFAIMFLVILFGFLFNITLYEWIACIILFGLVISSEMLNTAFEITVDIAMPEINEKAKNAKDIAAAAVLINSIMAATVGIIIFLPKLINFINF